MKKVFLILFISLFGCTAAVIPSYLPSKKPYVKRFFVNYDTMFAVVHETLKDLGWKVEREMDPSVYEQMRTSDLDEKQILLITEIRQMPLVVATRYARMNIYLRAKKDICEVEIRYLTISSTTFRRIKAYSNDSEVKRILGHLDDVLNRAPAGPIP